MVGALRRRDHWESRADLQRLPTTSSHPWRTGARRWAGSLSGGEQQMLAIGRAIMSRPRLLLLDEPSLGLAPRTTQTMFQFCAICAPNAV